MKTKWIIYVDTERRWIGLKIISHPKLTFNV